MKRAICLLLFGWTSAAVAQSARTPSVTFGDYRQDAPGVAHHITETDLPPPYATDSAGNSPHIVPPPLGVLPQVPTGFKVSRYATGLSGPRVLRVAPNGDVFVAESLAGRISVLRPDDEGASTVARTVFAHDLEQPFGIAFYPPGPNPQYVYIAETTELVRFAYHVGDRVASGRPEVILSGLPDGGHWTRDVVVAPDGKRLFLSIGSASNAGEGLGASDPGTRAAFEAAHGKGAAAGYEQGRADVLSLDPNGRDVRVYATGLRNCSGEAIAPGSSTLWCVTNERDGLGDNLPPDYVTHVQQGAFFGWPWYYIGSHPDPRHAGERPDLAAAVTVPDVLIQPHSAPLGITFYEGAQFPADYRGDAFVTLHGSWNRSLRTGYKVIRVRMENGQATGRYEDFITGFVTAAGGVWGRPVGVAVAQDGALLMSEDANGTIWRVGR
jgi:glucose/arabinose dehydrogenase